LTPDRVTRYVTFGCAHAHTYRGISTMRVKGPVLACLTLLLALPLSSAPAPAPVPAEPPKVFLNHFFVVVSAASYAAILQDPYLASTFAPFEKRTTVRNDNTYTGAYWYGRKTYFEVFEPPSQGPQGASGMAFSVDGPGESAAVKSLWTASLGAAETSPVTRRTETGEPTWFHMTAARGVPSGLRVWLMEYDKGFLGGWYPDLTPARGITRPEVLDRYVAKIGRTKDRETAVLRDVTALVIALDDANRERLVKHLVPAGWTMKAGGAEGAVTLTGPEGVAIEVVRGEGSRQGILEARFSVQGRPQAHSATLGEVRVEIGATSARVRFAP
jgi:hypothetical protein